MQWKIVADGTNVKPTCIRGNEKEPSVAAKMDLSKRSKAAAPVSAPPKGLLKDFQMTVHALHSLLAQVQHKHRTQVTQIHGMDKAEKKKTNTGEIDQEILQNLQRTGQEIQSNLAKAKFSLHTLSTEKDAAEPKGKPKKTGSFNQGTLQDLQRSVHRFQHQLAKARHSLHAHTGTKGEGKKMVKAGFDQGMLQDLQSTASTLQSHLASARHTLHAHLTQREALPEVGTDLYTVEA